MFALIKNFFGFKQVTQVKKIAFLDGDQPLTSLLDSYDKYLKDCPETILVRMDGTKGGPKILRNRKTIKKIFLTDVRTGKEAVDKFIGAYIQKAISDGYTDITVVSSDYDFIDIFKLAVKIDQAAKNVSFTLIVPLPKHASKNFDDSSKTTNIKVIKE